ncbi:EAL domain-containing protein [Pseudomonas chlororaphis]|uniref:cyclic-guanylate-specific phosphodiesterase n=1 Tax=Pseudomonas chlororaphis TaxID=587753 RepID=A0AAX3FTF2_9PSED|nr:EAL domain-containing protein [Pseudomonas chlororaphis]AZC38239.1 Rtn protein [Pseudomonas chlororaphis subsp. piscium]AZC44788.1 Rtn protein [Pseudomonas chlororaphis subsp. piscium]WDG70393.1 EAL domain-containing protein [Pseudomonas chlororaphis]WDH31820.1 EAL domain-containing protein [Pseudomonas chlororaphis]WDH68919.1 EAL domain-containing protein [Pseudomonas chlororaphis]
MPLTIKRHKRMAVNICLSVLIGTFPIVCGIVTLHSLANRTLEQQSESATKAAIQQFNAMLDSAEGATSDTYRLAGSPCEDVQFLLREQATQRLFVRTVGVTLNDEFYCSSLFGKFFEHIRPTDYVNGQLLLSFGNVVTPDIPVLIYRKSENEKGALAVIDGRYVKNVLQHTGKGGNSVLIVGPRWMSSSGHVFTAEHKKFPIAETRISSKKYFFSVASGFNSGEVLRHIEKNYIDLFGVFIFLGLSAGAFTYWTLGRAIPPSQELKRALSAGEFIPYIQPIVSAEDESWIGAEILMRWNHSSDGLVSPDLFIPYAEHSGLIVPMTQSIMMQVAKQLAPISQKLSKGFHIGFNISNHHCHDIELIHDCQYFLNAFPKDSITLVLEITEREIIEPGATTYELFDRLNNMGVKIALDDFGTGHSSLDYLRKFKVDYLKIDKSFVSMIGEDSLSTHIIESILALSEKINLSVVAEGIETPEQQKYLKERKVKYLQGYLYSRPLPLDIFIEKINQASINNQAQAQLSNS